MLEEVEVEVGVNRTLRCFALLELESILYLSKGGQIKNKQTKTLSAEWQPSVVRRGRDVSESLIIGGADSYSSVDTIKIGSVSRP